MLQRPGTVENICGVKEAARLFFDILDCDVIPLRVKKLYNKQTQE